MPPKAAEPSTKKFIFSEVVKMVFSDEDFAKPTIEEIKQVKWIAKNNHDDLDSREIWILENQSSFIEDDSDEVIDYD
jgi:uncharacterized membrane-anchored protein